VSRVSLAHAPTTSVGHRAVESFVEGIEVVCQRLDLRGKAAQASVW